MNSIITLNTWILTKITSYLSTREGFIVEESEPTVSGMKSIVRDSLGYRYEVNVKIISRLTDHLQDSNEINRLYPIITPTLKADFTYNKIST